MEENNIENNSSILNNTDPNIFEEEFLNIAGEKNKEISLNQLLRINLSDENEEIKINLSHIRI